MGFGARWVVFRTLAALIVKIGVKRVFPLEWGGDVLCAQLRAWHVVVWKVQFGGRAGHSDDDGKEGPGDSRCLGDWVHGGPVQDR